MSYANILVAVIQEAYRIYQTGRYCSNFEGDNHATPRLEVLAFFHSDHFSQIAEMLDVDPWRWRELSDIPQPTPTCPCESCRTDYSREARIVANLPRQHRFRFIAGARHYVQWKHGDGMLGGEIVRIVPQTPPGSPDQLLTAAEYLWRPCRRKVFQALRAWNPKKGRVLSQTNQGARDMTLFRWTVRPYLPPYASPENEEWDECPLTGARRPPVIDPHLEFEDRTEENRRRFREVMCWIEGAADRAYGRYGMGHPCYQATITWCFALYDQATAHYRSADWELACLCQQLREEEQASWDPLAGVPLSPNGHRSNGHAAPVLAFDAPF